LTADTNGGFNVWIDSAASPLFSRIIGRFPMKHERKTIREQTIHLIAGFFLLILCGGCAAAIRPTPVTGPNLLSPPQDQGWWRIRFRMDLADGQTRWERDLLIAHRIIAPLLMTHGQEIHLWRFHRRSAEDTTGHQISFLFYTSAAQANRINRELMEDPLKERLIANTLVREVLIDDVDENARPNIEDTSDASWSPVMQVAWPHYIMGVSRMWLEMIDQVSAEIGVADDATLEQLIDHYTRVNTEVSKIWQQEAYHALLHHLNAIYGYQPLIYWEKRLKTF
jgi:hypothetical protein